MKAASENIAGNKQIGCYTASRRSWSLEPGVQIDFICRRHGTYFGAHMNMRAIRTIGIAVLASILTACAATDSARISNSVASPLHDFNLAPTEIPAVLVDARKQPYQIPTDVSCADLRTNIKQLDDALGPDVDLVTPDVMTAPSMMPP